MLGNVAGILAFVKIFSHQSIWLLEKMTDILVYFNLRHLINQTKNDTLTIMHAQSHSWLKSSKLILTALYGKSIKGWTL
jgi:uncharacterized membrane protein SirB2